MIFLLDDYMWLKEATSKRSISGASFRGHLECEHEILKEVEEEVDL